MFNENENYMDNKLFNNLNISEEGLSKMFENIADENQINSIKNLLDDNKINGLIIIFENMNFGNGEDNNNIFI